MDWDAVRTWKWGGRWLLENPDVKRRKQAEFLVHERFPWDLVERIAVLNNAALAKVNESLKDAAHRPRVTIERQWYYNT